MHIRIFGKLLSMCFIEDIGLNGITIEWWNDPRMDEQNDRQTK